MNRKTKKEEEGSANQLLNPANPYWKMFDLLVEGVQIIDFEWRYLYVNDVATQYQQVRREDILGRTMMERFPDIRSTTVFHILDECMTSRISLRTEISFEYPDKTKKWFDLTIKPIDEGLVVLSIDVTDRVEADEKQERANHLYTFVSQVNQYIVRVTDEARLFRNACRLAIEFGKFKMAWIGLLDKENKKITLTDQTGIPASELDFFAHVPYENTGPQKHVVATAEHYTCNNVAQEPNLGTWKDFAARNGIHAFMILPIVKSGTLIGTFNLYAGEPGFLGEAEEALLLSLTLDISFALEQFEKEAQHRAAEAQVIKSEKLFRHTLDNMLEGAQIMDFDWRYTYVNDALVSHSTYTREELLGHTFMEMYPGVEGTELFQTMKRCMHEKIPAQIETEFYFPNGSKGNFELSIQPIPEGIFVLSVDRTEQKRAAEKVVKVNRLYAFLSAINQSIVHTGQKQELLDNACNIAVNIGQFQTALIELVNTETDTIHIASMCGRAEMIAQENNDRQTGSPGIMGSMTAQVMATGNYALSNDVQTDPDMIAWHQELIENGIRSIISFPLKISGKITGVFTMYAAIKDFFDDAEIALLAEASGDISFALGLFEQTQKHRETEALVETNEKRFRAMIEKGADMISLSDIHGKLVYSSPSVTKIFGYSHDELLAFDRAVFVHPDDIAAFAEKRAEIMEQPGQSFNMELRLQHKDGHWIWVDATITNLLDEPGVNAMIANFRDISDKKLAEQQREFDNNNTQAMINNTTDLMWSVDRNYKLITENQPHIDAVTFTTNAPSLKGENMLDMALSDEQAERFKAYYDRAFAGENFTVTEHDNTFGEWWMEISFYPIRKGDEIIGTACHSRDITERKKSEENLRRTIREIADYKYALDESAIVAVTDGKGIIRHVNENFCRISKYSPAELIGKDHRIINSGYHPKPFIENLWNTIKSGQIWRGELKNKAKDNTYYWVDTTIVPFLDESGKPYQYLAIRSDITARKTIEKTLRRSEAKLKEAQAIAHLGNWELSIETNITTWSEEACRIYGFDPTNNTHSFEAWLSFTHPDDIEHVRNATSYARETLSDAEINYRIILADGTVKHIYLKSKYELNQHNKPIALYGIIHDVTEIKQTEYFLRKSEAFNRGVLNSLTAHIAVIDAEGHIIAVNDAWNRFAQDNTSGKFERSGTGSNYYAACKNPEQQTAELAGWARKGMQDVMAGRKRVFYLEYECGSPTEPQWFAMRVMKFESDEELIVVSHENITMLKRVQQELDNTLHELEDRVETRTRELVDKNKNILDSINYAKSIQVGVLAQPGQLTAIFPQSFLLSTPRDIVSGDFFWCFERRNKKFIALADCTGHGVPAALLSIIGNYLLNHIVVDEHIENPSEILETLDARLAETVKGEGHEIKDGMDIALCVVDTSYNEIYFAGANRPLFVSDENGKIKSIASERYAIGGGIEDGRKKFDTRRFPFTKGQRIYLSSDGYYSQFGGPLNKKFMKSRFVALLGEIQSEPLDMQQELLEQALQEWAGDNEQVDDIMVIGIEL